MASERTIVIPDTLADATKTLNGLGALLHATEWQRAAIIAAFVEPRPFGSNQYTEGVSSDTLSPEGFSKLGIVGLKSKNTVIRYVEAWTDAGRARPQPGEVVNLDDLPDWPPNSIVDDTTPGSQKEADVKRNPKAVAAALADPEFTQKVIDRASTEALSTVVTTVNVSRPGAMPRLEDNTPRPSLTDTVIEGLGGPVHYVNPSSGYVYDIEQTLQQLHRSIESVGNPETTAKLVERLKAMPPLIEEIIARAEMGALAFQLLVDSIHEDPTADPYEHLRNQQ